MELISTVCSTFSRKPFTNASPRLSLLLACPLCLFSHVYLQLKIRVKITFSVHLDFDLCSIFLRCRLDVRIEAKAFCLEVRIAMNWECIGYIPVPPPVSIS